MGISIAELMEQSGVGFGTSGARGLVDAMTDEVCYLYTVSFLQYLHADGQIKLGCEVAIAGDLRASTPRIISAVVRAVESQGYHPLYCGFIPSPAVALVGIEKQIPSIMVTGSHIPDDRNGIKFNKPAGEILKLDEEGIRQQRVAPPVGVFDQHGSFLEVIPLPAVNSVGRTIYLNRYLQLFPQNILDGCRVGVYEHSSVARDLMVEVLEALGAEVIRLGRSEQFMPVDTEAIRSEDIELARQWVAEYRLDSLISTDGDGDRPLVSDEYGEWLRGDIAGILTARYLQARAVVTPVSSNTAVEKCGWFEQVARTRIGSPYVIAGMQQAMTGHPTVVVGYEANGGFLQATPINLFDQALSPLPTRDAMIVIIAILVMSREQGVTISELVEQLPARYTYSDRIKAFPLELSREKLDILTSGDFNQDAGAFIQLFGDVFGKVSAIDYTDGVRFTFDSSEVVHLRPSGNAPELRCYTEADSVDRAMKTNKICIDIIEGWRESGSEE
jgi:phosphomannomutase